MNPNFPSILDPGFPLLGELDLVALDLDGTVLCPRGVSPLSTRLRSAISKVLERGVPVTFVTGRTEDYALPFAQTLGVSSPLVTYNGGRIFCPVHRELLYRAALSNTEAAALLSWAQQRDEVVACYLSTPEGLWVVQNRCSGRPEHDDYLFGGPRSVVPDLLEAWQRSSGLLCKVIVSTHKSLEDDLNALFPQVLQTVRTHAELLEAMPMGVTKGSGLDRLCRHLGLDPKRVLAVGDQANDVPAFQVVGTSVAMGDAPDSVKRAARFVAPTYSEDGCAATLEALLRD